MSSLPDFVHRTAQTCQRWGVPYPVHELQICAQLVAQLTQAVDSATAQLLFDELVTSALLTTTTGSPWGWVAAELRFELLIARQGHRHQLALAALTAGGVPDDAALDLFNDRLQRPLRLGCGGG